MEILNLCIIITVIAVSLAAVDYILVKKLDNYKKY